MDLYTLLNNSSPEVAPQILGCRLTRRINGGVVNGIITEVEAYQEGDPASHTFNGETARTKAMFGPPGHAYIYFTYGMHWCLNVTADAPGKGSGVLIRAIEINEGYAQAAWNRFGVQDRDELTSYQRKNISNGPGKVAQALGVNKSLYGINLLDEKSELQLHYGIIPNGRKIIQTPRIGISKAVDVPWRWLYE